MESVWKRCEDVSCGQDAVHKAGKTYLPMLKDQSADDYKSYVARATFYNATWRTIAGLLGMLFRKPPQVKTPAGLEPLLEDVTMSGIPLHIFVSEIVEECLEKGRCGVLVDYPHANIKGATVAQAQSLGLRPSMQLYEAQDIINWRVTRINNQSVLSLVVITENSVTLKDEFTEESETHYRVLDLSEGRYRVRVFKIGTRGEDVLLSEAFPLMNNNPMDFIPFVFFGPDDLTSEVDDPPLIDLVNLNLHHYFVTATKCRALPFCVPTMFIAGMQLNDGEKLCVGAPTAIVAPDPAAHAGMIEYSGQGLGSLEKEIDKVEQQMAILGARMLEQQKRAVEAADTAAIHRKGEESILSSISQVISMGVNKCLGWFAQWAGHDGEVKFELNRDFYPVNMSPQELTALIAAWQNGAISSQSLFDNLKQGEIISIDTTFEEEQARISNSAPVFSQNNTVTN